MGVYVVRTSSLNDKHSCQLFRKASSLVLLSSSVSTANLSCLLATTFSSLRFLFNFTSLQSFESQWTGAVSYIPSVVLLKLHGSVVSHMQVLATTLLSVHNIKYSFCWNLTASMKTSGGLTRGRGMSKQQRVIWFLSMPACAEVNKAMQELTKVNYNTGEQSMWRENMGKPIVLFDGLKSDCLVCDEEPDDDDEDI